MSKIQLDIVTPEKVVYSEQVEMVITRAANGDVGILPKHAPFVSPLKGDTVRIKKDGSEEVISVSGGFIEVRPDKVTILAKSAGV
ncbi:ATP synthase F1 subunit epsilon [Laceyella sacchari]|jgi:F-type H+-transporting ATPase subunit epsilon|uniref:ATP synthase epsilon chain n=3 Tax=Laceyella TaxID=292635 RepID=A0AA45WQK3_9BACL|nr:MULTISPECIES: ATP synthase F1 subunit epsilon [Laceyella]AUS10213.1 ATP synthase F1 subunit epsilon [Laceyella sacchari]PRZ16506.1 ATP synthase F1 epsilon subunit [Laceyella sediminis]TCW39253.1 ATP synthase F1 epsilon subunit [Laceyella sacchari]UWE03556.1 ATP synthase F1 subunit epsilon [Laceyella sacchari]SMP26532.1 ATP synthase, F1 epsilon subunit [Laceyella tengchongensis]